MISPFEVYAVMQLDNIHTSLEVMLAFGVTGLFAIGAVLVVSRETVEALGNRYYIGAVAVLFLAVVLKTFLPSSTTAATMIILPKIANNETVQAEAREFYDLAKQGLKSLVTPDEDE